MRAQDRDEGAEPDTVVDGVFFTRPRPIPRGRHSLPSAEVAAAQMERLLIATTEVMASGGMQSSGVGDICARAAVSRSAFYQFFASKDDCVKAAYGRFTLVLGRRADELPQTEGWVDWAVDLAADYLSVLQRDRVSAKAFLVHMEAGGADVRRSKRAVIRDLAERVALRMTEDRAGTSGAIPLMAIIGTVNGFRQIVADAFDEDLENPSDLLPDLHQWLSAMDALTFNGEGDASGG